MFEGQIAKEQILKGPSRREIYRALHCKDLKEEGVMDTLTAIVRGEATDAGSHYPPYEAADHLAKFGPAAKDALPALRVAARSGDIELSGSAAFARWRIDGNLGECMNTLLGLLVEGGGTDIEQMHLIALLWEIGPPAKDAVPALCRLANTPAGSYRQARAVYALGAIRSRADIAVPALMREMPESVSSPVREAAMEAVAKFGRGAAGRFAPGAAQGQERPSTSRGDFLVAIEGTLEPRLAGFHGAALLQFARFSAAWRIGFVSKFSSFLSFI